ncbi:MAG: UDP-N-acetylmuramoyl-L-alanine--D-glutamate ligase [Bacteroidia bacterium]|nr:UDP-N-acetylmuramoyl-L-alanine--D-glutamate ligase [Bacteroidia bacterium]
MKKSNLIVVLGAGESGVGAALLAKSKGLNVFVSDASIIKPNFRKELEENNIPFEEGQHTLKLLREAELVIKSPGISPYLPYIQDLLAQGIPTYSEIEFAYQFVTAAKIIAVTGTNGKSTTVSLIYHILKQANWNVQLGGNIGYSFARLLLQKEPQWYVLEVSSYQLEFIQKFRPNIALILNLYPHHLERYNNQLSLYAKAKFNIFKNQVAEDFFIYGCYSPLLVQELAKAKYLSQPLCFGWEPREELNAWFDGNSICFHMKKDKPKGAKTIKIPIDEAQSRSKSFIYNSMAAGLVGNLLDIKKESIRNSFMTFENLEHRLERVCEIEGVEFINDSKATNVNSAWFALEQMNRNVIWVVGGKDTGTSDFGMLFPLVKEKVKALILLGREVERIAEAFSGIGKPMFKVDSMQMAVQKAFSLAERGEVVLLSPACPSFDMFENFEERGNAFKAEVKKLLAEVELKNNLSTKKQE